MVQHDRSQQAATIAYKFNGVTTRLCLVSLHPQILQVAQCELIGAVLDVHSNHFVVHERDWPEFGDRLDDFATLSISRVQFLLSHAL